MFVTLVSVVFRFAVICVFLVGFVICGFGACCLLLFLFCLRFCLLLVGLVWLFVGLVYLFWLCCCFVVLFVAGLLLIWCCVCVVGCFAVCACGVVFG